MMDSNGAQMAGEHGRTLRAPDPAGPPAAGFALAVAAAPGLHTVPSHGGPPPRPVPIR